MKILDFLSAAPRTFIFEKQANKSTFGGFLTIIYLIIIFLIAFVYIYNYAVNDKYTVSYVNYKKPYNETEMIQNNNDPNYNPTLNFRFDISDSNNRPMSKNYVILDVNSGNLIERQKIYEFKITDLQLVVLYNCSDEQCSIRNEDLETYNNNLLYFFHVISNHYEYNFEDEQPVKINKTKFIGSTSLFNQDSGNIFFNYWKVTKINEEPGLLDLVLGKKETLFGGEYYNNLMSSFKTSIINSSNSEELYGIRLKFKGIYKLLYGYYSMNQYNEFIEYKRKKISIISIFANICSLILSIYNGFKFAFSLFFSGNFDNYKIIQKILSKSNISFKKDINKIEDINSDTNSFPLMNELKTMDDVEKESEKDKTEKIVEIRETTDYSLPHFHFFHFICNIFSSICFKNKKEHKCLNLFNEIIKKYNSIDSIVYNQFMIENLLKDYKWNNPNLNSIKNIQLIDKLKQIINEDS